VQKDFEWNSQYEDELEEEEQILLNYLHGFASIGKDKNQY